MHIESVCVCMLVCVCVCVCVCICVCVCVCVHLANRNNLHHSRLISVLEEKRNAGVVAACHH